MIRVAVAGPRARSDPDLVRAIGLGDRPALGELYDRYATDVWRVARATLVDRTDAEDVVHAVFVKLPQIALSYDGRASCRAWLCGIAVRFALRQRRGSGRFRRMLGRLAESAPAPASVDPEQEAGHRERLALFEQAFACLCPKKRAAWILVELEGMTSHEAADVLEIPAATVRTRLLHARHEIRARMGPGSKLDGLVCRGWM
jgi:RNA polymerase sigma-70 factor (ECF subfamily)